MNSHNSPRTPNVDISIPGASKNTTKIPRIDTQEKEERVKTGKKANFWAPFGAPLFPGFGPPPFGVLANFGRRKKKCEFWAPTLNLQAPLFLGLGSSLRGPTFFCPTLQAPTMTHTRSKNGLANIGLARSGFGPNWPGENHDGQK